VAGMNLVDLGHRTVWTFVQTFIGTLLTASMLDLDWSVGAAALAAAVADVLVVVKEYARQQLAG
jgi:hypothetical protein